jgi:hypothetical protein
MLTLNNNKLHFKQQDFNDNFAVNATFNNISAIVWLSVLLVEETWVSRENHCGPSCLKSPTHFDFNDNFFILLFDQIHLTDSGYYIITDNTDL